MRPCCCGSTTPAPATRSRSTRLIQQGSKLTENGAPPFFGASVALSADGNTALIGGDLDNGNVGAAWVFTRSAGVWTQQGAKLTGSGETGAGWFGSSVALSADGNTALIGGFRDNGNVGAAWVFTRSGRRLDAAGRQAHRQRRDRHRPVRRQRGAVGRREHRPDRRRRRQRRCRGGVGVHPLGRRLDAAGRQAHRQRRDRHVRCSAPAWRCRPTGTPP